MLTKKILPLIIFCVAITLVSGCSFDNTNDGDTSDIKGKSNSKGNVAALEDMTSEEIAKKVDEAVKKISKRDNWEFVRKTGVEKTPLATAGSAMIKQWYLRSKKSGTVFTDEVSIYLFYGESREQEINKINQAGGFKNNCTRPDSLGDPVYKTGGSNNQYEFCSGQRLGRCTSQFEKDGLVISVSYYQGQDQPNCSSYLEEFLEVFDSI